MALRPNTDRGLLIKEASRSHTTTHHTRQDSSGRVISPTHTPLPDNTQHSQQIDIHAPGRIRPPQSQQASGCRHTPRGHWDQALLLLIQEQRGVVCMEN